MFEQSAIMIVIIVLEELLHLYRVCIDSLMTNTVTISMDFEITKKDILLILSNYMWNSEYLDSSYSIQLI